MDTKLYWVGVYLAAYAINGFQYFIDLPRADKNAIVPFMIFFGAVMGVLVIANLSWIVIGRGIWMFVWITALYFPITKLLNRIHGDD